MWQNDREQFNTGHILSDKVANVIMIIPKEDNRFPRPKLEA